MPNPNYGSDLLAGTFATYMRNKPTDAIFGDLALIKELSKHGKIRKDGGLKILEPVMYRKSTAKGSYNGYDTLDLTPQEVYDNAEFDWKQYYMTVVISGREEEINKGKSRMVNMLEAKINQAKMSLADDMNTALFSDGNGNSSKDLTGLAAMVLASGTYGNILRSSYSWWQANVTPVSGALAITGATGMRRMYNDCSLGRGRMTPDYIMTTQILHEGFEGLMDSKFQYSIADNSPANKGYTFRYKDADVGYDEACQSGVMYFLNWKVINLVVHSDRDQGGASKGGEDHDTGDFRLGEWERPVNQDAKSAKAFWMGNLTCNNPRFLGKLTGLTNT